MSKTHSNDAVHAISGSGDEKSIMRVIDKSNISSTSTIHKLSRGEICDTLTNLRAYLNTNATTNKKTPTPPPLAITSGETVLSRMSANLGFLAYDSINSFQTHTEPETLIPRVRQRKKNKSPWVMDAVQEDTSVNRPKVSAASINSSQNHKYVKTGAFASNSCSDSASQQFFEKIILKPTLKNSSQNDSQMIKKSAAIQRFQRFLERTKNTPARAGVKVCIQPEIAPEVMAAINASYEKHYGTRSDATTMDYNIEQDENYVETTERLQGDEYNVIEDQSRFSPEIEVPFIPSYNDESYEFQYDPAQYIPTNQNHWSSDTGRLDFHPPRSCYKRRTKFTIKSVGNSLQGYEHPKYSADPEASYYHPYQNTLMNQYYNYASQYPPQYPHPADIFEHEQNKYPTNAYYHSSQNYHSDPYHNNYEHTHHHPYGFAGY